jgi:hypothetical protein
MINGQNGPGELSLRHWDLVIGVFRTRGGVYADMDAVSTLVSCHLREDYRREITNVEEQ